MGDIFNLSGDVLGSIDAVFDRAALVTLPENLRIRYTTHVTNITDNAPQLLITYEYNQHLMEGPPFSVSTAEVNQHYQANYEVSLLASIDVIGGLKKLYPAKENI